MSWLFLIIAGGGEVLGVINMKKYSLTGKKYFIGLIVLSFAFSFTFLALAMKTIPMATAYAIWTGIGTAGSAIVGFIFYKEKATFLTILFIAMIAVGAIGLKTIQ